MAHSGWLQSLHTFSFGNYFAPRFMGFGPLRVFNEDRVQPGRGFGEHGHRDMEITSYVVEGALEYRDSMGNCSVIRPGEIVDGERQVWLQVVRGELDVDGIPASAGDGLGLASPRALSITATSDAELLLFDMAA